MAEDRIQLGRVVRALRKEHGWTQGKLKQLTGLSSSTIWAIEKGDEKHDLRDDTLDRLFSALGVTSSQVSTMIQELPPLEPDEQDTRQDAQKLAISMMARCLEEIGALKRQQDDIKKQQSDFKENQDKFAAMLKHIDSRISDVFQGSDPPVEVEMDTPYSHSDSGRTEPAERPQDTQ